MRALGSDKKSSQGQNIVTSDQTDQLADEASEETAAEAAVPSDSTEAVEHSASTSDKEASDVSGGSSGGASMDRFFEVNVSIWAELGRAAMPIGELLQLGEGAVLKLNRAVSEPVDLVAQGVRVARGEVVVVDDCFAIRIKEIENSK